jgi:hypothetical protein
MENRCPPSTATNKRESIENRTVIKYILSEELKASLYQWVPFVFLFEMLFGPCLSVSASPGNRLKLKALSS